MKKHWNMPLHYIASEFVHCWSIIYYYERTKKDGKRMNVEACLREMKQSLERTVA
jgi:hypothetical protein